MTTLQPVLIAHECFEVVYRLAPHGAHEGILIHWNEGFLIGIKNGMLQPIDGIKNAVYFTPLTGL